MFRPNLVGQLQRITGRDVHNRPTFTAATPCAFGIVHLNQTVTKTSVRTDASASHSNAEQTTAPHAEILVPAATAVGMDDRFSFSGNTYRVVGYFKRFSVTGAFDHIQLGLELLP